MSLPQVRIVCDGSSRGNGRQDAVAGAAALLIRADRSGVEPELVAEYLGPATNQQAEIVAACLGLETLSHPCQVELVTDSQYVVETMNGRFRRRTNQAFWERLDRAAAQHQVQWVWTPGHADHPEQELCDQAARHTAGSRRVDKDFLTRLLNRFKNQEKQTH